jgi:hypothetical protein
MAWIYLAGAECSLSDFPHGSDLSHIVKSTSMPKRFSCLGCKTAYFLAPQSGMTCPHCGRMICTSPLTSSVEDSPARTSALQVMVSDWEEADQAYFSRSFDSLAVFDPDSFSWKTSQLSLFGGLTAFCWSSLRWGTIVDGRLYQPEKWDLRTCENAGSYLPTPTASPAGTNGKKWNEVTQKWDLDPKLSLNMMATRYPLPTPCARDGKDGVTPNQGSRNSASVAVAVAQAGHHGYLNPQFVEVMMGMPIGWTRLSAWAMAFLRKSIEKHSNVLEVS